MNKQMKIWYGIHDYMLRHGTMIKPFVWSHNGAVWDLSNKHLTSTNFDVTSEWQKLKFNRGNMKELMSFCELNGINVK